jgi:hypothetical protein
MVSNVALSASRLSRASQRRYGTSIANIDYGLKAQRQHAIAGRLGVFSKTAVLVSWDMKITRQSEHQKRCCKQKVSA